MRQSRDTSNTRHKAQNDDNKNPDETATQFTEQRQNKSDEAIQRHQPHNAQNNDKINPMRQSRDTSNTRHKAQNNDKKTDEAISRDTSNTRHRTTTK
jgi:hypothetical protein